MSHLNYHHHHIDNQNKQTFPGADTTTIDHQVQPPQSLTDSNRARIQKYKMYRAYTMDSQTTSSLVNQFEGIPHSVSWQFAHSVSTQFTNEPNRFKRHRESESGHTTVSTVQLLPSIPSSSTLRVYNPSSMEPDGYSLAPWCPESE